MVKTTLAAVSAGCEATSTSHNDGSRNPRGFAMKFVTPGQKNLYRRACRLNYGARHNENLHRVTGAFSRITDTVSSFVASCRPDTVTAGGKMARLKIKAPQVVNATPPFNCRYQRRRNPCP
ncbi:hypothetical protein J6590_027013 [Homalodisca vitripennis]|nr:hypothetical protein J6590_027013 [Homalodisca vitripennis]